jgi:hypothetical protein
LSINQLILLPSTFHSTHATPPFDYSGDNTPASCATDATDATSSSHPVCTEPALPYVPVDDRRLVTFKLRNMAVVKVSILGTLDSDYSVKFESMEILTSLPTIELEQQYNLTVGVNNLNAVNNVNPGDGFDEPMTMGDPTPRMRRAVSRSKSRDNLSQQSATPGGLSVKSTSDHFYSTKTNSSTGSLLNLLSAQPRVDTSPPPPPSTTHIETGTKWLFLDFDAAFRLGLKLSLKRVEAQSFTIDFTNTVVTRSYQLSTNTTKMKTAPKTPSGKLSLIPPSSDPSDNSWKQPNGSI